MNAPLTPSYTNEVSAEYLRTLDKSVFTEEQLAGFSEEALTVVAQSHAYAMAHPAIAIYRMATEGSQTRNGGVIQTATSLLKIKLDDGEWVRVAKQGDHVAYADGSSAEIVTGAGSNHSHVALVGSRLNNGDEIIDTPQAAVLILARKGVPKAEDFLPAVKD